jgi:NAD-dependent DNA ligase
LTLEAFAETHAAPVVEAPEPVKAAPGPFAGQVVSFTGKLSMPRRAAVEMVQNAGGRAYADMPAGTTLLVVGSNPGMKKMDKADRWIGQVRKITEKQFLDMFPA